MKDIKNLTVALNIYFFLRSLALIYICFKNIISNMIVTLSKIKFRGVRDRILEEQVGKF